MKTLLSILTLSLLFAGTAAYAEETKTEPATTAKVEEKADKKPKRELTEEPVMELGGGHFRPISSVIVASVA